MSYHDLMSRSPSSILLLPADVPLKSVIFDFVDLGDTVDRKFANLSIATVNFIW